MRGSSPAWRSVSARQRTSQRPTRPSGASAAERVHTHSTQSRGPFTLSVKHPFILCTLQFAVRHETRTPPPHRGLRQSAEVTLQRPLEEALRNNQRKANEATLTSWKWTKCLKRAWTDLTDDFLLTPRSVTEPLGAFEASILFKVDPSGPWVWLSFVLFCFIEETMWITSYNWSCLLHTDNFLGNNKKTKTFQNPTFLLAVGAAWRWRTGRRHLRLL